MQGTFEQANKEENREKNRYPNILPSKILLFLRGWWRFDETPNSLAALGTGSACPREWQDGPVPGAGVPSARPLPLASWHPSAVRTQVACAGEAVATEPVCNADLGCPGARRGPPALHPILSPSQGGWWPWASPRLGLGCGLVAKMNPKFHEAFVKAGPGQLCCSSFSLDNPPSPQRWLCP